MVDKKNNKLKQYFYYRYRKMILLFGLIFITSAVLCTFSYFYFIPLSVFFANISGGSAAGLIFVVAVKVKQSDKSLSDDNIKLCSDIAMCLSELLERHYAFCRHAENELRFRKYALKLCEKADEAQNLLSDLQAQIKLYKSLSLFDPEIFTTLNTALLNIKNNCTAYIDAYEISKRKELYINLRKNTALASDCRKIIIKYIYSMRGDAVIYNETFF